jgi:HEPN domain-containing protein
MVRLEEAEALLKLGMPDGAYYLAGYAVECALKACISKKTRRYEFPDIETVRSSYTHDLRQLVKVAELETARKEQAAKDREFGNNWELVRDWSEKSRYRRNETDSAKLFLKAVGDRRHGVFPWIKQRW